jgi:hypothetical protein
MKAVLSNLISHSSRCENLIRVIMLMHGLPFIANDLVIPLRSGQLMRFIVAAVSRGKRMAEEFIGL